MTSANARAPLHWPEYLIEAVALGCFMLSACMFGTLLGHPASPVRAALGDGWQSRAVMGAMMGLTAIALIYSPMGRRSGAHMNPAFTLTFLRLGRIAPLDAAGYVAAQFTGGVLGVLLAHRLLGDRLADPAVRFVVTQPGAAGTLAAFAAEVVISGVLVTMVLRTAGSPRWQRWTGVFAGALVATWILIEAPISGMSMNPARTFGSAFVARDWTALWLYFTAPVAGMLLAAELFVRGTGRARVPCPKMAHAEPCLFCEYERAADTSGSAPQPVPPRTERTAQVRGREPSPAGGAYSRP